MGRIPLLIEPDPDDPDCANIFVDGTVAGRPYRFVLDTGAARTQLGTDEYTASLSQTSGDRSAGTFGNATVAVDLSQVNSTLEYPMDLILGYPTLRQTDWLMDFPARRWAVMS